MMLMAYPPPPADAEANPAGRAGHLSIGYDWFLHLSIGTDHFSENFVLICPA
jgi:hypothetical protein